MDGNLYLILVYSSYFLSATILSFLVNGLFLKFSSTLGIRDTKDTIIRWNNMSKPAFGGISFYIIFLLSISSYPIFFEQSGILFSKKLMGILASCTLAFLMGLSDDAYNTKPLLKLFVQIACGIILISTGTHIAIFENNFLNYSITIFWVVGLMNSINMLDNMDAITTVVSITILLNALLILILNQNISNVYALVIIGVLAALIGFLFFNWHPSKMFMGDTGSQFLGLFLAIIGILYFWNTPDVKGNLIQSKQFFATLLTFAVPIIDTTTVTINRIRNKKSPFIGGKDHTTHYFYYKGLTEKRIAILFALIAVISMCFNILIIKYINHWGYLHIGLFSLYFISLFWFMYAPTYKPTKE
jgi:UDP-GlcNAc:undecaprenyl-phosphate GlcNAc-1-phosphate transferase